MTKMDVGFVGLGSMGAAMARRLIGADATLHVHDVDMRAVEHLVDAGAVGHVSPRSVAENAPIVFTCLPTPEISRLVALGEEGLCRGQGIRVHVECSTVGRSLMLELDAGLSAHGIALVDAPVSGGPKAADRGELSVICAAAPAALDLARPWLRTLGSKVFEVGSQVGMAQMMKLVNNIVSAANMAAAFEAAVLGAKAGLDPRVMVDVLNAGTGRNTATETKLPQAILTGTFDFGARIDVMFKDMKLALAEAERLAVPMWVAENIAQVWRYAVTQGDGSKDYTTLIRHMEAWAGVQLREDQTGPHAPSDPRAP